MTERKKNVPCGGNSMFRVGLVVGHLVSTMEQVQVSMHIYNERRVQEHVE